MRAQVVLAGGSVVRALRPRAQRWPAYTSDLDFFFVASGADPASQNTIVMDAVWAMVDAARKESKGACCPAHAALHKGFSLIHRYLAMCRGQGAVQVLRARDQHLPAAEDRPEEGRRHGQLGDPGGAAHPPRVQDARRGALSAQLLAHCCTIFVATCRHLSTLFGHCVCQILSGFDLEHCAVALSHDRTSVLTNARGLNAFKTGLACVLGEEEVSIVGMRMQLA